MKDYTKQNQNIIDAWSEKYHLKWMQPITHEAYVSATEGDFHLTLTPIREVPKDWLGDIKGKKVLGLAAGGGQQMAVLSALGADCTLLDISEKQIRSDRLVSQREGYPITLIQGDMSEPLPFEDETFDLVINPVSNHYIEEVRPVFKEIHRVLKKGGIFLGGFDTGIYWAFGNDEKTVTRPLPFNPLKDQKLYEELMESDMGLQFSHTLEEQIDGQLEVGFHLLNLYEDKNPEGYLSEMNVPTFIATRARKD